MIGLGAVLALVSVVCYNAGYLLEKQALDALPAIGRPSVDLLRTLISSTRWVCGFGVMLVGLALQVVALTLAPVSVVQPILAGGTVALIVVARVALGERLNVRDRGSVTMLALGVVAVAVSSPHPNHLATGADGPVLAVMAAATFAAVAVSARAMVPRRAVAIVAIGLCYGTGAIAEKGVAIGLADRGLFAGAVASLGSIYPWLFVVATATGMVLFRPALQRHPASMVVPATNGISSAYALLGAGVVFGEPWAVDGWHTASLVTGYVAIVVGLLMLASQPDDPAIRLRDGQTPSPDAARRIAPWSPNR